MKKILLIIFILIMSVNCSAKKVIKKEKINYRTFGVGIVLGDPLGFSLKFQPEKDTAYAGVFSISTGTKFHVHIDYIWNDYGSLSDLNKEGEGLVLLYYGAGGLLRLTSDDKFITGLKGIIGVEYLLKAPFGVYLELSPAFLFTPQMKLSLFGGLGGRFYFN